MRPRRLGAAVSLGIALAVAVPGSAGAASGPTPGSPQYLARDAQNIADAYGRQTAPDGQLSPEYGLASAAYATRSGPRTCASRPRRRTGRR